MTTFMYNYSQDILVTMTRLILVLHIYIISYSPVASPTEQNPNNPIELCQFPNIPTHSVEEGPSVCDNMSPRGGQHPAETSPCPWTIFIFRETIRPHHTQPVTIGSIDGKQIFNEYIITAKPLSSYGKPFLGHFEPQWDADPVCCKDKLPNMLVSSKVRRKTANETVLWTAPLDYLGDFIFLVTFIISSRKYWFSVSSDVVTVVPHCRGCTHPHPTYRRIHRDKKWKPMSTLT